MIKEIFDDFGRMIILYCSGIRLIRLRKNWLV